MRLVAPAVGQLLSLTQSVTDMTTIAMQLTRERTFVATDDRGDLRLVLSGFQQGAYLISLVAGKLCVAHQCASLTWRLKSTLRYRSLP